MLLPLPSPHRTPVYPFHRQQDRRKGARDVRHVTIHPKQSFHCMPRLPICATTSAHGTSPATTRGSSVCCSLIMCGIYHAILHAPCPPTSSLRITRNVVVLSQGCSLPSKFPCFDICLLIFRNNFSRNSKPHQWQRYHDRESVFGGIVPLTIKTEYLVPHISTGQPFTVLHSRSRFS